jgi:hypothetical protein
MRLKELLGTLSYQLIITAFGFAVAGTLLRLQAPNVAIALAETGGLCVILSLLFYRLSNHGSDSGGGMSADIPSQTDSQEKSEMNSTVEAKNE